MNSEDRITVDTDVLVGKPIIKGSRIAGELLREMDFNGGKGLCLRSMPSFFNVETIISLYICP
ncbi:MAG: hypothetical protein ACLPVO_19335 [Desulfomonilaceae bacterium]